MYNRKPHQGPRGLGIAPAVAAVAVKIGSSLADRIFSSDGKYPGRTPVPGQPRDSEMAAMLARLNAEQVQRLSNAWYSVKGAPQLDLNDPFVIAKSAWGGSDGRVSTDGGKILHATVVQLLAETGISDYGTSGATSFLNTLRTNVSEAVNRTATQEIARDPTIQRAVVSEGYRQAGEWTQAAGPILAALGIGFLLFGRKR